MSSCPSMAAKLLRVRAPGLDEDCAKRRRFTGGVISAAIAFYLYFCQHYSLCSKDMPTISRSSSPELSVELSTSKLVVFALALLAFIFGDYIRVSKLLES